MTATPISTGAQIWPVGLKNWLLGICAAIQTRKPIQPPFPSLVDGFYSTEEHHVSARRRHFDVDRSDIEAGLILGFQTLRSRPCMTVGRRFVEGQSPDEAMIFNHVEDANLPDDERKALLTWARCRANGESWSDWCREMNLPKQTMEDRKARAINRMIAGPLTLSIEPDVFERT